MRQSQQAKDSHWSLTHSVCSTQVTSFFPSRGQHYLARQSSQQQRDPKCFMAAERWHPGFRCWVVKRCFTPHWRQRQVRGVLDQHVTQPVRTYLKQLAQEWDRGV